MSEKYQGYVRLIEGGSPDSIAKDLGVGVGTVYSWKKKVDEARDNGTVATLLASEDTVLADLAKDAALRLPAEIEESVDVVAKVKGLQRLDEEMQNTARNLNQRLNAQIASVENASDLFKVAETLCLVRDSFFGKGTVVNVQQNNAGGGSGYDEYLQDKAGVAVHVGN